MPRSLRKTEEPDLFDYGKAVTLILSKTKELHKTHNTLVDDVLYLETRKKQEIEALERVISQKAEHIKLDEELVKKIMDRKAAFMAEVESKKSELADREASLVAMEAAHEQKAAQFKQSQEDGANELELRSKELQKQYQAALDKVEARDVSMGEREAKLAIDTAAFTAEVKAYEDQKEDLSLREKKLYTANQMLDSQKAELDMRQTAIGTKEQALEEQRKSLSALASDLEGQASLIQSAKNKNDSDVRAIRDMQRQLYDKKSELDNREIHIKDRESIAASR